MANADYHETYRKAYNSRDEAAYAVDQVMLYAIQVAYLHGTPGMNLLAALAFKNHFDHRTTLDRSLANIYEIREDLPNEHWLGNLLFDGLQVREENERLQYDGHEVMNRKAENLRVRARQLLARVPEMPAEVFTTPVALYYRNGGKLRIGTKVAEKKSFSVVRFAEKGVPFEVRIATTDRDTPNCERGWVKIELLPRPTV